MAIFSRVTVLGLLMLSTATAFQVPSNNNNNNQILRTNTVSYPSDSPVCLFGSNSDNNAANNESERRGRVRKIMSTVGRRVQFLTPLLLAGSTVLVANPQVAEASAPVMAMPKAEVRDPGTDALENHQRKMQAEAQEELRRFTARARKIEAEQGPAAREKFEADYKADQEKKATERLENIEKLKLDLLDQGICPFIDIEGQRQIILAEKGVDLGAVAGTQMNVEKEFEVRNPSKSFAVRKAANREVIKCMVQDMKNRGIDPVQYFKTHQDKTAMVLDMPAQQAAMTAAKYNQNIDLYGQIVPPKEGEISAKERLAKQGGSSKNKDEAKRLKAEAKAKAAAEKAAARAQAAAAKAEAKAEKQAAKAAKAAAKQAAKLEKASAAPVVVAEFVAAEETNDGVVVDEAVIATDGEEAVVAAVEETKINKKSKKSSLPIVPVVVAVGGGAYGLKFMRDKAAADEEQRQLQLQLLMGGTDTDSSSPSSAPALEEVETNGAFPIDETPSKPVEANKPVTQVAQSTPKKKKSRGFFGRKKNSRETDINVLVGAGAPAPEFAKLLAKILVFGAPGRFPDVIGLPGDMPMEEFDTDAACEMLSEAQASAGLSKEDAAEVFANVVNCMLIDIVDLASASLGEKNNKVTVDAIGIVVDFMNHAASLYTAIAEGVLITPVTYGGSLAKSKLEQMYGAYAVSGMTNFAGMDESFEDRVALLQDVFEINEKKAEGIMMKAVQKQMMEMMKSGEGMEGMEEMMKEMGGLEGLGGLPGMDGEEPDPEQLKMMLTQLKELKDSGSIPESEMKAVKDQFREAFGSSIDQVMKDADKDSEELSPQDKEMLELMKSILDD